MNEKLNIEEIENEYKKIDGNWLILHYRTSVFLVLFAFIIECIMSYLLYKTGQISTSLQIYFLKYFLLPLLLNSICIVIGCFVMHSSHLTQNVKIYTISFLFVAICFVFYTVHCVFTSLYLIFIIPIVLTLVYNNYILTTATALLSLSVRTFSALFIAWDPDKPHYLDSHIGLSDFIISTFILCAFYAVCIVVIRFERKKNAASIVKEIERYELQQKLLTDELTGVNNRTALRNAFQSMEDHASENTYIFVMIDLDDFKTLNDTLGHANGDLCLQEFGLILKLYCADAIPFRFGGDEFCILFENQSLEQVIETCTRIQKSFAEFSVVHAIDIPLTASFGIAHYSSELTPVQLLTHTDSALYSAKTTRNSIFVYDS